MLQRHRENIILLEVNGYAQHMARNSGSCSKKACHVLKIRCNIDLVG